MADTAQPTADEYLNAPAASADAPTAAQFFTAAAQPQSGAAHDTFWASLANAGGRVLNSVGFGAQQQWGAEPVGLNPEEEASLRKAGIFNDYVAGHTSLMKSFNEAIIRPAADIASLATRGIPAAFAGVGSGLEQTAREVGGQQTPQALPGSLREAAAYPLAAAGELAQGVSTGFGGELPGAAGHAGETARIADASAARAAGVVGEGEAGFYDAAPLTPENISARSDAAKDAGVPAPEPLPPPPDIHALARRVDPETFEQFDALAAQRDQYRQTISDLGAQREASPEAAEAQGQIDTILSKVSGVEARLTQAARSRLVDAQTRLDAVLRTDTPEMTEARNGLLAADFGMRDLAQPVSAAYRAAKEMAPDIPERAPELGEPMLPGEQATEVLPAEAGAAAVDEGASAPQLAPAVAAGENAAADVAPPNVVGDQTLGEPAKPAVTAEPTPKTTSVLKGIQGAGEEQVRTVAARSEENAIATGLAETTGDLPTYNVLKDTDQAAIVKDLMDKDPDRAKAIAMGTREPPKGVTPEAFLIGVENRAMAEGDFETVYALKDSKLAKAATTMGQRISTYRNRAGTSPVQALQDIQDARERAVGPPEAVQTAKAAAVSEIKSEVRQAASKPDAWSSFIQSLEC